MEIALVRHLLQWVKLVKTASYFTRSEQPLHDETNVKIYSSDEIKTALLSKEYFDPAMLPNQIYNQNEEQIRDLGYELCDWRSYLPGITGEEIKQHLSVAVYLFSLCHEANTEVITNFLNYIEWLDDD